MIASITESLLHTSPLIQLIVLFIFSFGEGVPGLGTLLPGGTIAVLAGALSSAGVFSPITAAITISIGSFFGDIVGYILGKKFKHVDFVNKIINNEKHQKMWDLFDRHIALIAIFGKLIPVIRSTPSVIAGARGIKFEKYMIYSLIGSVLWGVVGVYAGNILAEYFGDKAVTIILWVLIITIVVFVLKYLYQKARTLYKLF